ncbi:MAG: sialate O-acetylesterase [Candidatus Pedobacter colombiensis]|uniref:Sialate O-acetylesterase n=1 Tax=Candidatus Pedobacter colombiensis TaxID=3121371 RepID=A0AAJ5W5W5_9SPHI|nr:sialate O-acetylesterase [Pedobacter sp.]WEK17698.1 MAG: sialate O-acetylesterase [Pedobacter sp.]
MKAKAKILLPQILSSNMVLQRHKPLNIWGFGATGEAVSVSFAGQLKQTITDANGKWKVVLAPLQTSAVPAVMTIKGTNTIVLDNILVGEVWLCSGQSNMEYAMRKIAKVKKPLKEELGYPVDEVEKANNSLIRIFLVNRKELSKPDSIHKSWNIARDSALKSFSAAGYFFAKALYDKLHIPIGVISSAVSGSPIEPWMPKESLETDYFKGQKVGNDPGKFYTPMIEPLTPFALRGFLWYQGETNCFLKENISYSYKMKALINSWRTAWSNASGVSGKETELPFYYVQIAPFNYAATKGKVVLDAETEPEFWEAQAQLLRVPNTGMVVTTDLNDYPDDLHPTYKWEIGRRLALWALANNYGEKINYSGPIYQSVSLKGETIELDFDHIGNGLISVDGKALDCFTVAGADGKFVSAEAVIKGNKIIVSARGLEKPTTVRFGWNEAMRPNLYNKDGLPALPFRTDNPLTKQFKPI